MDRPPDQPGAPPPEAPQREVVSPAVPAEGAPADSPADDLAPATVGDVRSLRRWIAVAGVWALAATAIAVIALLDDGDDEDARRGEARTAAQIARTQRALGERIDTLESRIGNLPQSEDVTRLDNRLKQVQEQASQAARDARAGRDAGDRLDDLEGRVEDLEQDADQGGTAPDDQGGTSP